MKVRALMVCAAGALMCSYPALAARVEVQMHKVDKSGVSGQVGTVTAEDTDYGLLLTPDLQGLSPGVHGFHVHENPDCGAAEKNGEMTAGAAAGGHLNPGGEGEHNGPYREGHLGDLPALYVDSNGNATLPVLAPRLEVSDIEDHALMVHQGGDTYTPEPKLGGGGARVACGVIEQ